MGMIVDEVENLNHRINIATRAGDMETAHDLLDYMTRGVGGTPRQYSHTDAPPTATLSITGRPVTRTQP